MSSVTALQSAATRCYGGVAAAATRSSRRMHQQNPHPTSSSLSSSSSSTAVLKHVVAASRHGRRAWRLEVAAAAAAGDGDGDVEGGGGEGAAAEGADEVAPEDYALVVELLDSETGEELKEKVDLVAKNGLLTEGVINAARVVVESNEAAGQDPEIIDLLRSVYDVLLRKFKEMYAPAAKAALDFGVVLMDVFTAEDLELMEAGEVPVSIGKVKLMMQEEFDKEGGVNKMAFAKYLDEVLPVMTLQDERLKEKMAEAPDEASAQALLGVMFNRTKERMKVEALRDIATNL